MSAAEPIDFHHDPVMRDEIVELFSVVPGGTILDATLGGGGHSEAILESRPDLNVLGLDRDPRAIEAATIRLSRFGDRFRSSQRRFDELEHGMADHGVEELSGALFDLGVSSHQLDVADRGFSFRHDGPLDMRMGPDAEWSAHDIVNGYDLDRLADIIRRHGDERFARRIAQAIVADRPIETTNRLAEVVVSAIPAPARRTGGHPAKRTFQAIRIEVNGELDVLPGAIDRAIEQVVPGGRVAVLSYHSGEDRIVKDRMIAATSPCECPAELPCVCGAIQTVRVVRRVPKRPTVDEVARNRRASSARLRVVERIAERVTARNGH